MKNWNCDGSGPCASGETRFLPLSRDCWQGGIILCHACYVHEIDFRRDRNRELEASCQFDLPAWESLKVYHAPDMTPARPARVRLTHRAPAPPSRL